MQFVDFIFGVLSKLTPMSTEETAQLKGEIVHDMDSVITDPEHELYVDNWKAKFIRITRNPWVRLGFAAMFLPVIKWVRDWYEGRYDEQNNQVE